MDKPYIETQAEQMALDIRKLNPNSNITAYFSFDGYSLGNVYVIGGEAYSNFNLADA